MYTNHYIGYNLHSINEFEDLSLEIWDVGREMRYFLMMITKKINNFLLILHHLRKLKLILGHGSPHSTPTFFSFRSVTVFSFCALELSFLFTSTILLLLPKFVKKGSAFDTLHYLLWYVILTQMELWFFSAIHCLIDSWWLIIVILVFPFLFVSIVFGLIAELIYVIWECSFDILVGTMVWVDMSGNYLGFSFWTLCVFSSWIVGSCFWPVDHRLSLMRKAMQCGLFYFFLFVSVEGLIILWITSFAFWYPL